MKRLCFLIILWLAFIPLYALDTYKVTSQRGLNVRSQPSVESTVLGSLPSGSLVEVLSIKDGWAEIRFKDKLAYISAKYISLIKKEEPATDQNNIPQKTSEEKKKATDNNTTTTLMPKQKRSFRDSWGVDMLVSSHVGLSGFMGAYSPKPLCGLGFGAGIQLYQKTNNKPRGYMSEMAMGYALKGAGGLCINYFEFILSPAGYAYTIKDNVTLSALVGCVIDLGGGQLYSYPYGYSYKTFYATPIDVGVQVKFVTEWHQFNWGISYDQGFIGTIANSPAWLLNYGINFHFSYRLWDILNNNIYKQ